ncbi:MAG: hypothetical protein KKC76_06950 [Proteobacteria bacterium]|nr:hypothetical protein [Pseudomonadota bacterium]MBU4297122.1 hypothetical protein [Pseudomonadota bacterium]
MADKFEKEIEELLQKGKSKTAIWEMFRNDKEPLKVLFYLNNSSLPRDKKKFQVINLLLAIVLLFMTSKKLITAFSFGALDIFLVLSLVVPVINIYVLREILRFHRIGYQFLFVLSCLALLQPENHHEQELFILGLLIGLSGYLYRRMFQVKDKITI